MDLCGWIMTVRMTQKWRDRIYEVQRNEWGNTEKRAQKYKKKGKRGILQRFRYDLEKEQYLTSSGFCFSFCPSSPVCFSFSSPLTPPFNFCILSVLSLLFPLTHISWNLQRDAEVLCFLAWKMDEWFAAFVWLHSVCAVGFVSVQTPCACLCEIWCKQNKLSSGSAVFLMFYPKIITQTLSRSITALSLTHVQMAFIGIKHKGSYCRNKSSSCKQHEIVAGKKKKKRWQIWLLG